MTAQDNFKRYDSPEQCAEAFQQMIDARERWLEQVREQEAKITNEQYESALARIEELLPKVDENMPSNDRRSTTLGGACPSKEAVELTMMSDIVIDYEKEHYPIGKPAVHSCNKKKLEVPKKGC